MAMTEQDVKDWERSYASWKRARAARGAARRARLYDALIGGLTIIQKGGAFTAFPSAPSEWTPLWCRMQEEPGFQPTREEIERHFFPCGVHGGEARARYLADHIENRWSGFGWKPVIVGAFKS